MIKRQRHHWLPISNDPADLIFSVVIIQFIMGCYYNSHADLSIKIAG